MDDSIRDLGREAGKHACNTLPGENEQCVCRTKVEGRLGTSTGGDLIVECESEDFYPHR